MDDAANTVFYSCITNEMANAVEQLVLHELGLPKDQMIWRKPIRGRPESAGVFGSSLPPEQ
jgi:hypothetical protein